MCPQVTVYCGRLVAENEVLQLGDLICLAWVSKFLFIYYSLTDTHLSQCIFSYLPCQ